MSKILPHVLVLSHQISVYIYTRALEIITGEFAPGINCSKPLSVRYVAVNGRCQEKKKFSHRRATFFELSIIKMTDNIIYISIGEFCGPAVIIKDVLQKKIESHPFDWAYSTIETVQKCVEDDFGFMLEKLDEKKNDIISQDFRFLIAHKDISSDSDFKYYVNCIKRIKKALKISNRRIVLLHMTYADTQLNNTQIDSRRIDRLNHLFTTIQETYPQLDFAIVSLAFAQGEESHTLKKHTKIHVLTIYTEEDQTLDTWIEHVNRHKSHIKYCFETILETI